MEQTTELAKRGTWGTSLTRVDGYRWSLRLVIETPRAATTFCNQPTARARPTSTRTSDLPHFPEKTRSVQEIERWGKPNPHGAVSRPEGHRGAPNLATRTPGCSRTRWSRTRNRLTIRPSACVSQHRGQSSNGHALAVTAAGILQPGVGLHSTDDDQGCFQGSPRERSDPSDNRVPSSASKRSFDSPPCQPEQRQTGRATHLFTSSAGRGLDGPASAAGGGR